MAVGFMESVKGGAKREKGKGQDKDKDKDTNSNVHDGAVHLYSFSVNSNNTVKMEKLSDGCVTTAWVNNLNFSPSGKILTVGSHDKKIYFYEIPDAPSEEGGSGSNSYGSEWANCLKNTKFIFDKHSSAVLHLDFSLDGKYLQTDSQVRTILIICRYKTFSTTFIQSVHFQFQYL